MGLIMKHLVIGDVTYDVPITSINNETNGGLAFRVDTNDNGKYYIGHSNVLNNAQSTQAVYPIAIDKNGHISAYGNAVTIVNTRGTATSGGTTLSVVNTGDMYVWNNKQDKLTNPVTGTGRANYLVQWNGGSAVIEGPKITANGTRFLKEDGTWATVVTVDEKVKQTPISAETENAIYELLFSESASNSELIEGTRKTSALRYHPALKVLINSGEVRANKGVFNELVATTLKADSANITNLTAQNATVIGLLDVQGDLHTNSWTNANMANIGGSFYISPTIAPADGSTTITINRVSATSWTIQLIGTFATDFIKSGTSSTGVNWPANSLVLVTGNVTLNNMVYPLGTLKGTLSSAVTASAASTSKTITITGVVDGQGGNTPYVLQELYELNGNANLATKVFTNGKISLYQLGSFPIGIQLSSMGVDSNSIIDIYGGVKSTPTVRIGHLAGLPAINNETPTGWGIYTDNGYFSGVIVSTAGKIGGFTIGSTNLYNGTLGATNSVWMSTGTSGSASIGGSSSINNWAFTASNQFGVTKTGELWANLAHIKGSIDATSFQARDESGNIRAVVDSNGLTVKDAAGNMVAAFSSSGVSFSSSVSQKIGNNTNYIEFDKSTGRINIIGSGVYFGTKPVESIATTDDIPTKVSDLTNDSGYQTASQVSTTATNVANTAVSNLITVKEASGNIVSVDDASAYPAINVTANIEPIQDLNGYDKPWVGGAGKNKLPYPYDSNSQTINDVVFTVNADGTIKANGTATAEVNFNLLISKSLASVGITSGTYTLNGCPSGGSSSTYRVQVRQNGSWGADNGAGVNFTYDASSPVNDLVRINIQSGTAINNLVFKPMIRKSTDSATYEPYENICPISGHTEVDTNRTGKNLLSSDSILNGYQYNSSGILEASAKRVSLARIKVGDSRYISISWKSTSATTKAIRCLWDSDGNLLVRGIPNETSLGNNRYGYAQDLNSYPTATYIGFTVYSTDSADANTITSEYMVSASDTSEIVSEFETYGTIYTTDLGRTVYGGTLDVTSGELTVDRAYLQATSITSVGTLIGKVYWVVASSLNPRATMENTAGLKSSHFLGSVQAVVEGQCYVTSSGNALVAVPTDQTLNTKALADAWMAENKPQFTWLLAEPQTYQLTAQQIDMLLGINNVWSSGGDTYLKYTTMNSDMLLIMDKSNADRDRTAEVIQEEMVTTTGTLSDSISQTNERVTSVQSDARTAQSTADSAMTAAGDAAKTATNYISPDGSSGITLHDQDRVSTGVKIDTAVSILRNAVSQVVVDANGMSIYSPDGKNKIAQYGTATIIGDENDFHVVVSDTELGFYQGAIKVAYLSNNQLYIEQSVVLQEMAVGATSDEGGDGKWIWKVHKNASGKNNLGLKWNA